MLLLPQTATPNVSLFVDAMSAWVPEPEPASREHVRESAVSHDRARILSIGDDPILLYSRRLVLERDGYLVASFRSNAIVEETQFRGFDLVMLCHSIPDDVMSHILEVLWRLTPQTPVLLVSRLDKPACPSERYIAVSAQPVAMLDTVAEQLALHQSAAGFRGKS